MNKFKLTKILHASQFEFSEKDRVQRVLVRSPAFIINTQLFVGSVFAMNKFLFAATTQPFCLKFLAKFKFRHNGSRFEEYDVKVKMIKSLKFCCCYFSSRLESQSCLESILERMDFLTRNSKIVVV